VTTTDERPPATEAEADPRRWIVLGVLCVNLVLVVAAVSSANVALPTLTRPDALGASQTELQWIVDAYALVFAGLLLPAGAIGDRFGR
jgi:MFS family permease